MSKDTTGPAFPGPYSNVENQGLTKREWFAALAMQGFASDPEATWPRGANDMARCAYEWADAMIEEGKK